MAPINCTECGCAISDGSVVCGSCGIPAYFSKEPLFGDFDGDGKRTLNDVKVAADIVIERTRQAISTAQDRAQSYFDALKKDSRTGLCDVDTDLGTAPDARSPRDCAKFVSAVESTIDIKFASIMERKAKDEEFLTYVDGQIITASVRNIYRNAIGFTPPEIDAACKLSEAVLAPSAEERKNLIRAAAGVAGGTAGIGMILGGIGVALGWGAGVGAAITGWLVGTAMAGPIGWIMAGVTLAGISSYFAVSADRQVSSESFINALKASVGAATTSIWSEHEGPLTQALESVNAA